MRTRELEILNEARRWGLGRDLGSSATDMHLLALLQHHGVPTRFIDVTANPMTALWFAIEEHRPQGGVIAKKPGVLFAIDVTKTDWYETFHHAGDQTVAQVGNPLSGAYRLALESQRVSDRCFARFPRCRMTE